MTNDLRLAVRGLFRQPGFSALAVLTLALGIGATTAIFSVVDHVVLRPMPYPNGDRMCFVWMEAPKTVGDFRINPTLSYARRVQASARSFDAVEIYQSESRVTPGESGAETLSLLHVRPSLFSLLEGRARLGRTLVAEDLDAGAPPVLVISHEVWTRRYGRDPEILSRDVRLDDEVFRIVGVMEPGFRVPSATPDGWIALRRDPRQADAERRVTLLGVLKPGITTPMASDEIAQLVGAEAADDRLAARGFVPDVIDPSVLRNDALRRSSLILFGAVGLLLLIGCANVAALLVTRNAGRAREVAIRRALGATRGRLFRHLLMESVVLSICAGVAGAMVSLWILEGVRAVMPERLLSQDALQVDGVVLGFTALLSLVTAILFGLLPAVQGSNVVLTSAMRGDARSGATTRSKHLTRRILTSAEIALAVVLLVGAGLLIRSFVQLQRIPLGFDPHQTLSASVSLPESRYPDVPSRERFFNALVESTRALPGVTAAELATSLPPMTGLMFGQMTIRGRAADAPAGPGTTSGSTVSDGFFTLMGIPILEGRAFGPQDRRDTDRVAVINATMARRVWPGQSAIGQQFSVSGGKNPVWTTVVGIAGDVKAAGLRSNGGHGDYQVYFSARQSPNAFGSIVLKTAGDPSSLLPLVRARIGELDPMLPVSDLMTLEDRVGRELAADRFNLVLLGWFSGLGLLLAAVGVYGMMAMYVAHRRYEIGVRLALGATPRAVVRLIMGHAIALAAAGVVAGVAGALALTRLMSTLLYEVTPTDPATFGAVIAVVSLVAVVASAVPVRRALLVDPATALRLE